MLFSKLTPKIGPKLNLKLNPSKRLLIIALWTIYGFFNLTANESTGGWIPHAPITSDFNILPNLSPMPFMYSEFIFNPSENENPKNLEKITEGEKNTNKIIYPIQVITESNKLVQIAKSAKTFGKAIKFYEQALKVCPDNVKALTEYGKFLENQEKFTDAGELYYRALLVSPENNEAKICKERVYNELVVKNSVKFRKMDKTVKELQLVMKRDCEINDCYNTYSSESNSVKNQIFSENSIFREMFYLQIYHTVAIEGNTLGLHHVKQVLKTGRSVSNHDHTIRELNEIVGAADAFQYANWTLYRQQTKLAQTKLANLQNPHHETFIQPRLLNLKLINDLHYRILARVDPQKAGHYRNDDIYVSGYKAPPAEQLKSLMTEFEHWLSDMEEKVFILGIIHPVEFAAQAHYRLVKIHPYPDGNGRLSRLLMNIILMRAGYPPTLIRVEDRRKYFGALNYDAQFLQFILGVTGETLNLYLNELGFEKDMLLPSVISGHDEL